MKPIKLLLFLMYELMKAKHIKVLIYNEKVKSSINELIIVADR